MIAVTDWRGKARLDGVACDRIKGTSRRWRMDCLQGVVFCLPKGEKDAWKRPQWVAGEVYLRHPSTTARGFRIRRFITAATVALIMARNASLSPAQVEDILMSTSVDLGTPGQDNYFGHGRIDAAAAVAAAGAGSSQPPPEPDPAPEPEPDTIAPTVAILSPDDGSTVSRTVTITIAAQDNVAIAIVKCYVDGALKGTTTASSLSCNWNTRKAASGTHTLRADTVDTAGLTANTQIQVQVGTSSTGGGGKSGGGKGRRK